MGVKTLTMLGLNKILAMYVGPAGYAAFGQFQNVVQMISTLATAAINTGVTKYTAEYQDNEVEQRKVWRTAGTFALTASLFLSVLVFIFRERLAQALLDDAQMSPVFVWFSTTLVLFVFNTLLLAILNGKKEIVRYVMANIAGSVFALTITTFMVVNWGLLGALIALVVYQSFAFFVTFYLCTKTHWFRWRELVGRIDLTVSKNLLKFMVMALTTAATGPLSQILIRGHLGETISWEAAGYWEAMWRLSGGYLMLVTTTLSVYYLPRLSEIKNSVEMKNEILSGLKLIMPFVFLCASLIYYARNDLIILLFSESFSPMEVMFFWQLIGDIIKIASWLFAYIMISKSMTSFYVSTEILFSIGFYILVIALTKEHGLEGAAIAYAINYTIYFIVVASIIIKKHLRI